jgi:TatD DNase family protein
MMLVDSHCHLDFPDFSTELDQVVERAGEAGVGIMVTISTHLDRFPGVLAIAERFSTVYASVGVHPHEADTHQDTAASRLIELARHPKVVGIGETGLDYYYEHSERQAQQKSFRQHIEAARVTGLPLIVHTRDADADTIAILRDEWERGPYPGLIHCFSGGPELAKAALDLGLYISISGIATFKKADELRETIRAVPIDRVLVETDAPYLAPVPYRGKRNEPAFVSETAARMADLFGLPPDQFARTTTDNFHRLFNKVPAVVPVAA